MSGQEPFSTKQRRSVPQRGYQLLPFALLALFLLVPQVLPAQTRPGPIRVEWKSQLLTVHAENAPLSVILKRVVRATGVDVSGLEKLQGQASVNFSQQPLSEGLQVLLPGWDYAFAPADPALGRRGQLLIMVRGSANPIAAPAAPLSASADADAELGADDSNWLEDNPEDDKKIAQLKKASAKGDANSLHDAILTGDAQVQEAAFEELRKTDPVGASAALSNAAQSDKQGMATQSLALLMRSGADKSLILTTLGDDIASTDVALRTYVAQALPNYGADAMSYLQQALADSESSVRLATLQAVARDDWAQPLVQQEVNDADPQIQALAAQILQQMQAKPAGQAQAESPVQTQVPQPPQNQTNSEDPFADVDAPPSPN
jgi:hypothetical protein